MRKTIMFWDKKEEKKALPDLPATSFQLPNDIPTKTFPDEQTIKDLPEETVGGPMMTKTVELTTEETIPSISQPRKSVPIIKSRAEEVFVKIDKFVAARKALQTAEEKVNDIESLLKKIRETKLREEQELSNWEKEVSLVKAKIEEVNSTIFDKL